MSIVDILGWPVILTVLAILADAVLVAVTVLQMLRAGPPLFTQVDQVTGGKRHGMWLWLLVVAGEVALVPVAWMLVQATRAVSGVVGSWWWLPPVVGALIAAGVLAWKLLLRSEAPEPPTPVAPVHYPVRAAAIPEMWAIRPEDRDGGL